MVGRYRRVLLAAVVALALAAALVVEGEHGFLFVFGLAATAALALLVSLTTRRPARPAMRRPVVLERAPRREPQGSVREVTEDDADLGVPASRHRETGSHSNVIHLRQRPHRPPRLERPPVSRTEPPPPPMR